MKHPFDVLLFILSFLNLATSSIDTSTSSTSAVPLETRRTRSFLYRYNNVSSSSAAESHDGRLTTTSSFDPALTPRVTLAAELNASTEYIPGLITSRCLANGLQCVAICGNNDTLCLRAGSSYATACSSSWDSYDGVPNGIRTLPSGWSSVTGLEGQSPGVSTSTLAVYTSFSTANASFVKEIASLDNGRVTTMTPVYALGPPSPSITVKTYTAALSDYTYITGPTPSCKFAEVWKSSQCGQCTMTGGTVQMFYWPPVTAGATDGDLLRSQSVVLDGTTLWSPTVYISLQTVHAENSCSQLGMDHTSTMISLAPADVSTQVHFGGKAIASGANSYGPIDYSALTGLPSASAYEAQPDCIMFGCPTIYPTTWQPTLVVPTQLRSLDPAWRSCAVGLEGLYDPPIALTQQVVMAGPTTVPGSLLSTIAATPCVTPTIQTLQPTSSLPQSDSQGTRLANSLSNILVSALGTQATSYVSPFDPEASTSTSAASTTVVPSPSNFGDVGDSGTKTATRSFNALSVLMSAVDTAPGKVQPSNSASATPAATSNDPPGSIISWESAWDPSLTSTVLLPSVVIPATNQGPTSPEVSRQKSSVPPTSLPYSRFASSGAGQEEVTATAAVWPDGPSISTDSGGNFVIDGATLAPGSVVTVPSAERSLTISMVVSDSATFIALGTSKTVPLASPTTPNAGEATLAADGMTFTSMVGGNYVGNGMTIQPGGEVTLHEPGDRNTAIQLTTLSGDPALLVGATLTTALSPVISTPAVAYTVNSMTLKSGADGAFEIEGLTLYPGKEVTLSGSSADETLILTSVAGLPAIVVDGTKTESLGTMSVPVTESLSNITTAPAAPVATSQHPGGSRPPATPTTLSSVGQRQADMAYVGLMALCFTCVAIISNSVGSMRRQSSRRD